MGLPTFMFLLAIGIGIFIRDHYSLPVTSDGSLYIAPVKRVSLWKSLAPEAIDCRASEGRRGLELTFEHKFFKTIEWSPHMTIPTSGFSCYRLIKRTKFSRSFFGYDALLLEQYQKYRENHPTGVEYPFPSCHWMGEDIEESRGLIIVLNPVEYDPFTSCYRDYLCSLTTCAALE